MKSNDRIKKTLNILKTKQALTIGRHSEKDFTRKSPLGFENLCNLLIFREGKTNQMEIYNFFNKLGKADLAVTKSALTQQREKLNPEIFKYMNLEYVKKMYEEIKIKTIDGTELIPCGIDGSVLEVPNTKTVQENIGYIEYSKNKEDKVTARAQTSGIYDSCNNIMVQSIIKLYGTSEKELAKEHIEYIENNMKEIKDRILYIFDRAYISIEMLLYLNNRNCKYLFRVSKSVYKKEISQMKSKDEVVKIELTANRMNQLKKNLKTSYPKEISVRVVKVKLDTGEEEILITNISKEEINTEKMKQVYFMRWKIESSYDIIKNKLQIESFSGYSRLAIEQDFYAQILLFNMIEDIKRETNESIISGKGKYEYIVNTNILIGIAKYYLLLMSCTEDINKQDELEEIMLKFIKQNLVAIKPGRKNERYKFGIKNKYKTNMKRSI